ncbi:MAG TPA: phosphatase PAP2 family protein [bacterium]|nr:phosphatase PAP2 family protein [bacterium]
MRASPARLIASLILFLALAAVAAHETGHRWDVAVTTWVHRAAPAPDLPTALYVFAGNAEVVVAGAALAGLLLLRRDRTRAEAAFGLAGSLVVLSLLAVALKHLVPHPGPPDALQRHVFRMGISVPTPFSFPSGHTLRATFIAGTVLRGAPVAAIAVVGSMMASLVYLGDHWASDVLGGLCLGWAAVETARAVWSRLRVEP